MELDCMFHLGPILLELAIYNEKLDNNMTKLAHQTTTFFSFIATCAKSKSRNIQMGSQLGHSKEVTMGIIDPIQHYHAYISWLILWVSLAKISLCWRSFESRYSSLSEFRILDVQKKGYLF
jgi:hypothetical protein